MYSVRHVSYCGMAGVPEVADDLRAARDECARRLRAFRKRFPVATITRGMEWEIQEPEGCKMVPDACGTLAIRHVTFECRECGSQCETRDVALECCAPTLHFCEEEE
jgi:hypothetical protein